MWIAPTDISSNFLKRPQQKKTSSRDLKGRETRKQGKQESSRNTPPHAKLSEAFKGNKLGVSSQKETY